MNAGINVGVERLVKGKRGGLLIGFDGAGWARWEADFWRRGGGALLLVDEGVERGLVYYFARGRRREYGFFKRGWGFACFSFGFGGLSGLGWGTLRRYVRHHGQFPLQIGGILGGLFGVTRGIGVVFFWGSRRVHV